MAELTEYDISINFSQKGAEQTKNKVNDVKSSVDKLKTAVKGIAIGGALKKLGETMFNLTTKTADYIETVNLFRASMGSAADEAQKFIDKAEQVLGLDPKNLMDSISSFQNLSEGFGIASDRAYTMSQNLTQLSADLSSFANISFEEAQKKLMSGFSGQVMPLRKYGIALDQATLQETAYSLGLQQRVKDMTRAQKTELIYYQIMTSTQKMQGDLSRSLLSPANAVRVMKNEFTRLARAVGSIFIPILMKIIPVVRAITELFIEAAQAIAAFFGFDMSNYNADLSNVGGLLEGVSDDIGDIGDAAEDTTKKMNKMLMPFDELNNISTSAASGASSGLGGVGGGSLGIDLPEYNMFTDATKEMTENIEKIKEKIKALLPFIAAIGAAFAGWKISNTITNFLGKLFNWSDEKKSKSLQIMLGITLLITGITMVYGSVKKILEGDTSIQNLLLGLFGAGTAGVGAGMVASGLGLASAGPIGWTIGIALALVVAISWIIKKDEEIYTQVAQAQGLNYDKMGFWDKQKLHLDVLLEISGIKDTDDTDWGKAVDKVTKGDMKGLSQGTIGNIKTIGQKIGGLFSEEIVNGVAAKMGELTGTVGGNIVNFFQKAYSEDTQQKVRDTVFGFFDKIYSQDTQQKVRDKIFGFLDKIFGPNTVNTIKDKVFEFFGNIFNKDTADKVWEKGKEIGWNIVKGIADGIYNMVKPINDTIKTFVENMVNAFKDKLGIHSPSTVFADIGKNLIQGLLNGIQNLWGTLTGKFNDIKNLTNFKWSLPSLKLPHLSWTTQPAPSWISNILSALNLPTSLPKLNVSWYAKGGFPETGELFYANEAGPELVGTIGNRTAVANKDQITTAIAEATYQAMSRALANNNSDNNQPIIVNIGNEQLYKGFTNYQNQQSNMYGINI